MDNSKFKPLFLEETYEHLSGIEKGLLALEKDPSNSTIVDSLFRHYHSIKGMCGSMGYEMMQKIAHVQEDLLDPMRGKDAPPPSSEIISTLLECLDVLKAMTRKVEEDRPHDIEGVDIELLIKRVKELSSVREGESAPAKVPTSSPGGTEEAGARKEPVAGEPGGGTERGAAREPLKVPGPQNLELSSVMKVESKVFDRLLHVTGDQLSILSSIQVFAEKSQSIEFREAVHELGKTISVLHTNILSARMLPFRDLTQNLSRIVRDLSKRREKAVDLNIEGGEISLDKSTLEKMGDPLVQIIKNAVDHGIEGPDERQSAGKNERGTITVRAFEKKELVVIEVEDDGRGIDCEKLRQKAVSLGMPKELIGAMGDEEALMLVCRPGLSLSDSVTYASGRGVGMDVVKESVEGISGFLHIKSEVGKGTRIVMEFLRSASIRKVLLVSVCDELFSLPAAKIEKVLDIKAGDIKDGTVGYNDMSVPYRTLSGLLGLDASTEAGKDTVAVLVEGGGGNGSLVALGVADFGDE